MPVGVGDQAPDFELKNQDKEVVRLSDFRGRSNVVLVFYPFAFSGICTGELCGIRDDLATFSNDDTVTLAVSTDPIPALKAFSTQESYPFPLLTDFWPHGAVAQSYGVFNEQAGAAKRGTFVIDKSGVVRHVVVNEIPDARDQSEIAKALADL